jgi:hypothetical protein
MDGWCGVNPSKYVVGISDYWYVRPDNPTQLKAALNFVGPISIAVGTWGTSKNIPFFSWFDYEGGIVDDYEACPPGPNNGAPDHAALLVGYGTDEWTGQEYWLIKNSFGSNWGEDGFIRILIGPGKGVCGVNQSPVFATAIKPHMA